MTTNNPTFYLRARASNVSNNLTVIAFIVAEDARLSLFRN